MDALASEAISYASSHGIVVSTPASLRLGASLSHAPITALPSPLSRTCHEYALRLGVPLNSLVYAIACDHAYLRETLAETAAADAFTARLLSLLGSSAPRTGVEMALTRHDFFVDASSGGPALKMVEMNCIAASFACLGARAAALHRYVVGHPVAEGMGVDVADLPEGDAGSGLAHGLASAHATFLRTEGGDAEKTKAVMVVQGEEKNVFDQDILRNRLWEAHGVDMVRLTMGEIHKWGSVVVVDDKKKLVIERPGEKVFTASVVYYRAGYGPGDYPSEDEWAARAMVEGSVAVKCPSIAVQLVGTKKIQQVLDMDGQVERFVKDGNDANLIRGCFARQYSLAVGEEGDKAAKLALASPDGFVLKPQREGGGNNLYSGDMVKELERMTPEERSAYVLMERLRPVKVQNTLIRGGQWEEGEIVSEFGVYGVHVTCDGLHVENSVAGTLLRSKLATHDDGGVAAGVAVLDSPRLVD